MLKDLEWILYVRPWRASSKVNVQKLAALWRVRQHIHCHCIPPGVSGGSMAAEVQHDQVHDRDRSMTVLLAPGSSDKRVRGRPRCKLTLSASLLQLRLEATTYRTWSSL